MYWLCLPCGWQSRNHVAKILVHCWFLAVMAFPKASRIGFVWMILSCQHAHLLDHTIHTRPLSSPPEYWALRDQSQSIGSFASIGLSGFDRLCKYTVFFFFFSLKILETLWKVCPGVAGSKATEYRGLLSWQNKLDHAMNTWTCK